MALSEHPTRTVEAGAGASARAMREAAALRRRPAAQAGRPDACTVVIVSYRTGPLLMDALKAALTQEDVDKVVLVDNGNSDRTRGEVDALSATYGHLRVLRGHGNVGFARGCNLGARLATASHILLLNPDCVLRPGVVRRGLEVLAENPDADALTVRIENPDGSEQRGSRRRLMTPWTVFVEQLRLDRLLPNDPRFQRVNLNEQAPLTSITPVECISGAFMLMPRSAYERVGGMDEDYFLHVEDVDLCLRIGQAGGSILYVPDVAVTHLKGTSRVFPLVVEWHKSVSAAKYFRKHFSGRYPVVVLRLMTAALFLRLGARAVPLVLAWALGRRGAGG